MIKSLAFFGDDLIIELETTDWIRKERYQVKESWFKINSRLVVENPANWSKSRLGILSELSHEALLVFLFLKVAGNFQKTFRVSREVLTRVASVTGSGQDVDDILQELETCNLVQVDGQDFILTDSSFERNTEEAKEPTPATDYSPELSPADRELRAKAFAGLCDYDELDILHWNHIITDGEMDDLIKEHKYIGKDPFGISSETKK